MAEPEHVHDHRCWWDHLRCGWVCTPARLSGARSEPPPPPVRAPQDRPPAPTGR